MSLIPPTEPVPPAAEPAEPGVVELAAEPAEPAVPSGVAESAVAAVEPAVPPAVAEPAGPVPDPVRQLSLFGVEAVEPSPDDLAGLLAGPGQVVRMGGTARVSVVVEDAWRVHVLVAELALRGLASSWVTTAEERLGVRTQYATTLAGLGRSWLHGAAMKRPPADFYLNGLRLRLWAAAAGGPDQGGFTLRLGPEEACWEPVGAALAAVGLTAVLLGPRAGGPAYRITGRRRLARLAELVGDRPPAAPPAQWPGPDRPH